MKTLSPKIVKALSEKLGISEKTVKNSVASLAKDYPSSTSNSRAQIYARRNGLNIYHLLDKEDKQTLPNATGNYTSIKIRTFNKTKPKRAKIPFNQIKHESKVKLFFYAVNKLWRNISNPQKFLGALFLIIISFALSKIPINTVEKQSDSIPQTTPTVFYPSPSVNPTAKPQETKNLVSIRHGSSYIDSASGITVGVNWVLPSDYSELTITYPGKKSEFFNEVKSGTKFYFKNLNGTEYVMTVVEIGFDSIEIRIDKGSL